MGTLNVLIDHFLTTVGKPAGNILNGLGMYQVGFGLVLCPCPCNGLVLYQLRTPPLAPSD